MDVRRPLHRPMPQPSRPGKGTRRLMMTTRVTACRLLQHECIALLPREDTVLSVQLAASVLSEVRFSRSCSTAVFSSLGTSILRLRGQRARLPRCLRPLHSHVHFDPSDCIREGVAEDVYVQRRPRTRQVRQFSNLFVWECSSFIFTPSLTISERALRSQFAKETSPSLQLPDRFLKV
jgi:hypothetical protein